MKKVFTILCLAVIATFAIQFSSKAQDYDNAIGGRFGAANGVTFKTSLGDNKMIDLIANFRSNDNYRYFRITGLYEVYKPIQNAAGLNWYYGAGASIGTAKWRHFDNRSSDLYLSVDGVLGLDYKFVDAPINISLDWKPAIELTPDTDFDASGVGLSLRFTF
ncbi:hypothetical protein ACSBL2_23690 [Pedobacter sp. AW31-3R]|uniref:hypothetical protein n=1 Tax=Pedobacter sp. AW31-3R TaxID=3445781 RepID=UPI003FA0B2A9